MPFVSLMGTATIPPLEKASLGTKEKRVAKEITTKNKTGNTGFLFAGDLGLRKLDFCSSRRKKQRAGFVHILEKMRTPDLLIFFKSVKNFMALPIQQ